MATAVKTRRKAEKGGKFRILVGVHFDDGPEGCQCDGCYHTNPALSGKNHVYRAREAADPPDYDGDVIDSEQDLVARFNQGAFSRKFERIAERPPQPTDRQPGETMKQFALRMAKLAEAQEPDEDDDDGDEERNGDGDNLDGKTVKELTALAEAEEIEIPPGSRKEQIVELVRGARRR